MFIATFAVASSSERLLFESPYFDVSYRSHLKQSDTATANFSLKTQGLTELEYLCIFKSQNPKTAKLNHGETQPTTRSSRKQSHRRFDWTWDYKRERLAPQGIRTTANYCKTSCLVLSQKRNETLSGKSYLDDTKHSANLFRRNRTRKLISSKSPIYWAFFSVVIFRISSFQDNSLVFRRLELM